MKLEHYKERVEGSKEFKEFKKKHKKAYLGAGFFILDFENGKNMHQLDYCLPNGKIATFILDDGVKMKLSDQTVKKELPRIPDKVNTDIDALKGIVHDEMRNRTVTEEIKKIIAVLHILDKKVVWNLQCILNGLGVLSVHVDDADQSVLKFERYSLMDLIKKQDLESLKNLAEKQAQKQNSQVKVVAEKPAKEEVKK